jgi:parvulin-like peptidyl-prolyl isomerase
MFNKKKNRIPTEFRRKPFIQRIPEWSLEQIQGLLRLFGAGRRRSTTQKPPLARFQQVFDRQLNLLIAGTVRRFREVTRFRLRVRLWILVPIAFALGVMTTFVVLRQRRSASEVMLSVRNARITSPEFYHRMEIQVGPQTLTTMLREELALQFAAERHLLPTEEKVRARMKQIRVRPGQDELVRQKHLTETDIEHQARLQLTNEALLTQNVSVTEEEAHAFYLAQSVPNSPRSEFWAPSTVHVSAIANTLESAVEQAGQELARGKGFADVARKYSLDRTAGIGGRLPPIYRGRTLFAKDTSLESSLFETPPGKVIGPRQFAGSWWLIKVESVEPPKTIPYNEVRQQCLDSAKYLKAMRMNHPQLEADFAAFRTSAKIQVFWDQYFYDLTGQKR